MKLRVNAWDADIDYVRLTTRSDTDDEARVAVFKRILSMALASGQEGVVELKPWAWFGYVGEQGAHGAYGRGRQGCLLQASSWAAAAVVERRPPWDNCSRLDIQVTLWLEEDTPGLAEELATAAHFKRPARAGRKPQPQLRKTFGKGDTLYLGARGSDKFVRIYDKWREQGGDDEYRHAWRFELELHNELAGSFLDGTWRHGGTREGYLGAVATEVAWLGLDFGALLESPLPKPARKERSGIDNDSRAAWLYHQVRPAIEKMIASGYRPGYLRELLGLMADGDAGEFIARIE